LRTFNIFEILQNELEQTMTISEKIHQAKLAFASGNLQDDRGYLPVAGVGLIKLSDEFLASTAGRRSQTTGTARARWNQAVEAAMVQCRGDKKRATALVAKQQPHLREQLVSEANIARTPTATAVTRPTKVSPTAAFNSEVQKLVEAGMTKLEAVKLLSKRMGLSSNEPSPGFVSTRQQYR